MFTLNELENKHTYAFFLDVQKAYDTVWCDGLWLKLWDLCVKGRMWHVINEVSKSAVLLEGKKSTMFSLEQVALSPVLFSVIIDDLLREVEKADLGIQLWGGKKVGGMLFANDFVGVSGSKEGLQRLISVVHGYCNK